MLPPIFFASGARARRTVFLSVLMAVSGLVRAATEPKTTATPAALGGPHAAALARVLPAVVRVEAIRLRPSDGHLIKLHVGGSGAIISAQGHVLTNCHVAEDADFYRCYLYDGTHVEAKRVGQDALTDLAVLQLDLSQRAKDAAPLTVASFADSDKIAAGQEVFALGSPAFLAQSVTRGIVANSSLVLPQETVGKMILRGEDVGMVVRWILHDASIFGGNSGGPLVNTDGQIVGINELGVANLGGAIPGNLGQQVAKQLIAGGAVVRGWSGLTVQPRLEASGAGGGVCVADVAPNSPAARAGMLAGDVIVSCDGHAIEDAEEKAVAHFYRFEMGRLPGNEFVLETKRGAASRPVKFKLAEREPAQADDVELRGWGAVVRDLTAPLTRDERLPDKRGVWLENIRPAGPVGQGEPELRRQDVIVAVDGQPIGNVAELKALTDKILPDTPKATHTVLASVRRDGAVLTSVVELRNLNPRNVTPPARKAWLGAVSQPLTVKLAARLAIKSEGGARLTRIYPGTKAEAAGLKVGDVVIALDGAPVTARRAEDIDALARQIRQYRAGTDAVFTLWRDGQTMTLPVTLEEQPKATSEMPWWEDDKLEFAARDLAFDDRMKLQLANGATGALIESVVASGWAALAGLRGDDLVLESDGKPIAQLEELKQARADVAASGRTWWVLLVQRRGQTQFVEINLKPLKK